MPLRVAANRDQGKSQEDRARVPFGREYRPPFRKGINGSDTSTSIGVPVMIHSAAADRVAELVAIKEQIAAR